MVYFLSIWCRKKKQFPTISRGETTIILINYFEKSSSTLFGKMGEFFGIAGMMDEKTQQC